MGALLVFNLGGIVEFQPGIEREARAPLEFGSGGSEDTGGSGETVAPVSGATAHVHDRENEHHFVVVNERVVDAEGEALDQIAPNVVLDDRPDPRPAYDLFGTAFDARVECAAELGRYVGVVRTGGEELLSRFGGEAPDHSPTSLRARAITASPSRACTFPERISALRWVAALR